MYKNFSNIISTINVQNFFKNNFKNLIFLIIFLVTIIIIYQFYKFYQHNKILQKSLDFYSAKNLQTESQYIDIMNKLSQDNDFYGLISSVEILNNTIKNKNYEEAYELYLKILEDSNVDFKYKNLLAIHGSFNLIDFINTNKILNLTNYIDKDAVSFEGFYQEILFLIAIKDNNKEQLDSIYEQIINNEYFPPDLKQRVNNIYEYTKYK